LGRTTKKKTLFSNNPLYHMETKQLTCQDCGNAFDFTAEEQQFFTEKGFQDPKRCGNCRRQKKDAHRPSFTKVTCSGCGMETEVPFVPKGDRPVYCRACFEKNKMAA
jgi:CxxC-x17-CxxC domain-containing protein